MEESRRTGEPLHEVEERRLGASHAQLGAYLLGIWGLPYPVIEAVAYHHKPHAVEQTEFDLLAALVLAESLTLMHESSTVRALDAPHATADELYLARLSAPFDFGEAQRRVAEMFATATGK